MRILTILILLAFSFGSTVFAAGKETGAAPANTGNSKRIIKWVDSHGVTHYGDKLPAQEAGRSNSEMTNHGVVVKQNVTNVTKNEQEDAERLAQQRKDGILLASYTKVEEIDMARDRYLQMDQAAIQALTSQKDGVNGRLTRNMKTAEGFGKRNKPVPAYVAEEISIAKNELVSIDRQIAARKQNMQLITARFSDEKARFMELKQLAPPAQAGTSPSSNVAVMPTPMSATATTAK